ncbi:MAG: general secretion pathway protein, partial [Rubripirellula sp.]|nr:general secretion pathway protein [Rubripirellula sp.]
MLLGILVCSVGHLVAAPWQLSGLDQREPSSQGNQATAVAAGADEVAGVGGAEAAGEQVGEEVQVSEEQRLIDAIYQSTAPVDQEVGGKAEVGSPDAETVASPEPVASGGVRFSFDRTPWRDVIRWIADEADLALHVGEVPTGSFSYADPSDFTIAEAIDRINLFLQPEGFAILRSGQMLSVINLGDPRSKQQLDALARMVEPKQLPELPDHDVVRCLFPLGEIDAQGAVAELEVLNLMVTPEVLGRTNQLLMIETVAKLQSVKKILDAFQSDEMANGTVVQSFALKHVGAEDVLDVARPHLGLAPGEMIGIDVSVSVDVRGQYLYVTGVEDKVKLLEGLIKSIDQPKESVSESSEPSELRRHLVEGGNVDTVYNVLQTLLAGREVRLSVDTASSSLVAWAPPSVQTEIEQTVMQLQAAEADFEVIPLRSADPFFVISLLEEMLDLPGAFADPDEIGPNTPRIDADPANRRLFVRAKRPQLEQIKKIVEGLDGSGEVGNSMPRASGDQTRILPLQGED